MKRTIFLTIIFTLVFLQVTAAQNLHMESFETVWRVVNEKHYDPTFGGLDWREVHDRYKPRIAETESDAQFRTLINTMLFELGLSHLLVASDDDLKKFLPTLFAEASIGVDIDLIGGKVFVKSVESAYPAIKAGLRPGFLLESVDGVSIEQIIEEAESQMVPPFNDRNRQNIIILHLLSRLYGSGDTSVTLTYRDEKRRTYRKIISRQKRGKGQVLSTALPPFFIDFEAKILEGNIGYIRFNHFADPVSQKFDAALELMKNSAFMIIDLRRNSGGFLKTLDALAARLIVNEVLFYTYKMRDRNIIRNIAPAQDVYLGPVALIVDETSMSCSEIFASALQSIGRVVIVGERTAGYSLLANWTRLPNGDSFMHTIALNRTPDGHALEGYGVVPDIEVKLDQKSLLRGIDSQIQAAIEYFMRNQ
jgi:carboxyl-terminal processing protease